MPNSSPVTHMEPKVPTNALRDALAEFDGMFSLRDASEERDFLTGDEHPELAPDESGW